MRSANSTPNQPLAPHDSPATVLAQRAGPVAKKDQSVSGWTPFEDNLPLPEEVSNNTPVLGGGTDGTDDVNRPLLDIIREVSLMSVLPKHPNVVGYLGCAFENPFVLLCLEFVPGGSLESLLEEFGGALPERSVRRYMRHVATGLDFIHNNPSPIVHRDLKPGNVLITRDGECKLADFGAGAALKHAAVETARRSIAHSGSAAGSGGGHSGGGHSGGSGSSENAKDAARQQFRAQLQTADQRVVGTAWYMSPEQCSGEATTVSDVWSFGIMFAELLTGRKPWNDAPALAAVFIARLAADDAMAPALPASLSADARAFIEPCLRRDPAARPSARDLLRNPFLAALP